MHGQHTSLVLVTALQGLLSCLSCPHIHVCSHTLTTVWLKQRITRNREAYLHGIDCLLELADRAVLLLQLPFKQPLNLAALLQISNLLQYHVV